MSTTAARTTRPAASPVRETAAPSPAAAVSREGRAPLDARVSALLHQHDAEQANGGDSRKYRMSDGRLIDLPDDMTAEQAARLEVEARNAQNKLGKKPRPPAVPEVHKPADHAPKLKGKHGAPGPKRGAHGAGKHGPRSAGVTAKLKMGGGTVAQYLLGKAAPVLARGAGRLGQLSRHEQTHDDAERKRTQAEHAVVVPDSEGQSRSNTGQVKKVEARPAPPVDPAKGRAKLKESLADNIPQSIEDVDNFKRDQKAQHTGADVLEVVQGDKNAVVGSFSDMEHTPAPTPPDEPAVPLPAPETAPGTPGLNLGQGAVAPIKPEHTDVSAYTKQADAKLQEEGVTQEQLDMVDSGDLASANTEKKGMAKMAAEQPRAVQAFAHQQADKVDKDLRAEEKHGRDALHAKRKHGLGATGQKQKAAKSALEKKRDEVAAKINGIYKKAQDKVKKTLADLEVQSMKRFDDGNAKASKAFEDDVNHELDLFKDDRYSGVFGWARKAKDWLLGMDDLPEVKAIFDRNRARFVERLDRLVADIGADNKRVVQECKDELARARTQIQEFVDKLGPDLKDIGKKTAGEVSRQLDELDNFVRKKETELQDKLEAKQQAAIKAIDEKIEKMKDAMSGALSKLGKLLLYAAKKFFTWALEKFGYSLSDIEAIISRGAAVLKAIFTKPIVFVKNLMNAAILGFQNFGKNFLKHLQDALFEWLTGSLEGLVLPTTWDFQGVIGVALQMIGISYQNVRRHLVNEVGETAVSAMEKGFTLVKTLVTEGPMAAWEQLKDMAADMRDAFIDAVKDFIKTKIIEQAIQWVVSLFLPAAGIIKAIIGIYDTVVFFIQKAKQIATMVSDFLGSIGEIASGNIGAAATAMENGLARGLTLVISFLAQLLHLNGITAKIRDAIQKIRSKVDGVLAKVAKWIAGKAKALVGKLKSGAKSIVDWWKMKLGIEVDGKKITLTTEGTEEQPELLIQASPKRKWSSYLNGLDATAKAMPEFAKARTVAKELEERNKITAPDDAKYAAEREKRRQKLNELGEYIKKLNGTSPVPLSVFNWESVDPAEGGTHVDATILSQKHGPGSGPGDNPPIWRDLQGLKKGVRRDWYVQGHLLNDNLGGPGKRFNLTPLTKEANNKHKADVEAAIKKQVHDKHIVVYYSVKVLPPWGGSLRFDYLDQLEKAKPAPGSAKAEEIDSIKALRKLTRGFECRAYELELQGTKWVQSKKPGHFDLPKTPIPNKVKDGEKPYGY